MGLEHKYGDCTSSFSGVHVDELPFQNKIPSIFGQSHNYCVKSLILEVNIS